MDLNSLLHRNQLALTLQEKAANAEERQAYVQFARDYSVRIQIKQSKSGAPSAVCGFPK